VTLGKIIAIDVAKMKVYKSIDYPEHRNLSGINKAGETKNVIAPVSPAVLASTSLVLGSIIEDMALFLAATRTYLFAQSGQPLPPCVGRGCRL
jgi:hypothetical protein